MERLFIYAFIGLVLLAGVLFLIFRKFLGEYEDPEMNFGCGPVDASGMGFIPPAPSEEDAYADRQSSLIASAIKKAPKTIMTTVCIQLFLMVFAGYMSVKNIERIGNAGAALSQGEYGLAIAALWPIGKDAGVEQWRIATGINPYLEEKGITGFEYVGKLGDKSVAIMNHLYSTQDQDEGLKKTNESYGRVIIGLSAGRAKDICEEKYNGKLISSEEWELSRGHFIAARNVKLFPEIPEWTRDISEEDSNDYLVIAKESGVREYAIKEDLDMEEGGKYIDNGDLSTAGFRCSITW